jgi:hypothetical protein
MRRVISLFIVAVVVLTAFLLNPRSGSGCHGTCHMGGIISNQQAPENLDAVSAAFVPNAQGGTPTPGTKTPKEICKLGVGEEGQVTTTLLGFEIDTQDKEHPDRPLCLIDVLLEEGATSDSTVVTQEAAVLYVKSGTIEFTLDPGIDSGLYAGLDTAPVTYHKEVNGEVVTVNKGDSPFQLTEGGSVVIDPKDITDKQVVIELVYHNVGSGQAELVIASSPYTQGPDPTS